MKILVLNGSPKRDKSDTMFNAPKAAVVTVPRLELIKMAGRQYAEKGEIEASLLAEITSPMIPEDQYAAIVNSGV